MIAITGAGGQLGRCVAAELVERAGDRQLRLGSRSLDRIVDLERRGIATVSADFDAPGTLEQLFQGCRTALVISGDAAPSLRLKQHANALAAAKSSGVERVVYTSFINAGPTSMFSIAANHGETEEMLRASGMEFTILRNNHYAENILFDTARQSGELAQSGALGKIAYISRLDVAAAVVGALLGENHGGKTYEITGPEALDNYQLAEELAAAWGRVVTVRDVSHREYEQELANRGYPADLVELLVSLRKAAEAGEYAHPSTDAAELARRPIASVREFIREIKISE